MSFMRRIIVGGIGVAVCIGSAFHGFAQETDKPATSSAQSFIERSLVKELESLRAKVRKLESAVGADAAPMKKMGMGKGMSNGKEMANKGMARKDMDKKRMAKGKEMMAMKKDGMGMMGRGPKMGGMSMNSGLPGFAGASHIYHVGGTGFFLNHPEHITLEAAQQKKLNEIKSTSLLAGGKFERQIEQAEEDLWSLTADESPDIKKIEAKIREVGTLTGDRRIAFIRAVGKAAEVLTNDQRKKLAGEHFPE
jgi:Spy/CpxP family protein refolding chaperone